MDLPSCMNLDVLSSFFAMPGIAVEPVLVVQVICGAAGSAG